MILKGELIDGSWIFFLFHLPLFIEDRGLFLGLPASSTVEQFRNLAR
jgi:hypothetical protein